MASANFRRAVCRSSVWAAPPIWEACSAGNRLFTWQSRGTMRPARSFNGLRAERRAGVAFVRTAPVDWPERSKDNKRMTDQNESTKPTKPLTLSTTARSGSAAAKGGGGETQVRQKFSHGRTRAVTVEVKKPVKRPTGAPAPAAAAPAPTPAPAPSAPAPAAPGRTLKLGGGGTAAPAATARASTPSAAPSGARSTLNPRP